MFIDILPPTTGDQSRCGKISNLLPITDAYLRIGAQTRGDLTRKAYDPNPFYLEFGRWGSCLGLIDVSLTSSNDAFTHGQVWSLTSTISPDSTKMLFSGNLTSTQANLGNFFNVNHTYSCADHFFLRSMIQYNGVSLRGAVSPSEAALTFRIASGPVPTSPGNGSGLMPPEWAEGWVANGSFVGNSWGKGGFLVLKDGTVMTEGSDGAHPRSVKTIIIAVCVGVAVLLALVGCCWFCCCRRRRQSRKKMENDASTAP